MICGMSNEVWSEWMRLKFDLEDKWEKNLFENDKISLNRSFKWCGTRVNLHKNQIFPFPYPSMSKANIFSPTFQYRQINFPISSNILFNFPD